MGNPEKPQSVRSLTMMWLLVFPLLLLSCFASPSSRIVGGSDAYLGEFPHMVSIQWAPHGQMHHLCGGSILNDLWILTAAHCNMLTLDHQLMKVIAGAWDFRTASRYQQEVGVDLFINHPHYPGGVGVPHNIALIRVNQQLYLNSYVYPVTLPPINSYPLGSALFSGWGWTVDEPPFLFPDILQRVQVPLISLSQCYTAFIHLGEDPDELDTFTHICTGPLSGGISACSGDLGGPLVQKYGDRFLQVGIAIRAFRPCGREGAPTVYIRVSAYVDWIRSVVNEYSIPTKSQ